MGSIIKQETVCRGTDTNRLDHSSSSVVQLGPAIILLDGAPNDPNGRIECSITVPLLE